MKKSYRICDRLQINVPSYSSEIFERLRPVLKLRNIFEIKFPSSRGFAFHGTWRAVGLNESWRFIRYRSGGHLSPHVDGSYVESTERRTMFTCNIYLNELQEEQAGETVFCARDQRLQLEEDEETSTKRYAADMDGVTAKIRPQAGHALIFQQAPFEILHAGRPVRKGLKFLARSDIMYERLPETKPKLTSKQIQGMEALRKAKESEASGKFGLAMKMYSKAFRLWPELEEGDGAIAGI